MQLKLVIGTVRKIEQQERNVDAERVEGKSSNSIYTKQVDHKTKGVLKT